jgi:DNA polymerase-3 subunit delta'
MAVLLERALPSLPPPERAALAALSDGSPGQALALAAGEGVAMQHAVDLAFTALPAMAGRALLRIADEVTGRGREIDAFVTFMALLRRAMTRALRQAARGASVVPGWVAARPLAEWAAVWDKLGRLADDTERLNLDRRQAVLTGLTWLRPERAPPP